MTAGATYILRDHLDALFAELRPLAPAGALDLTGDTTHLVEGWLDRVTQIQCAGNGDDAANRKAVEHAVRLAAERVDCDLRIESPGDVIPLPAGHAGRARSTAVGWTTPDGGRFVVRHFDPYSVVFRGIARGDEPDYHTGLRYLAHGWMEVDEAQALLDDLLPRFTAATIAQDPAEFRRKWKGLLQMWAAQRQG